MDKRHYQIVRENWRRIIGDPIFWIFGFFAAVPYIFPTTSFRSEDLFQGCVRFIGSFFSIALSAIGSIGLIHIANNLSLDLRLTLPDVWKRSVGSFFRVIVINLILGNIFVVPLICFVSIFGRELYENPFYLFLNLVVSSISFVIGILSACGVVITELGIFDSLKNGVTIFGRQIIDMFLFGVSYLAFPIIVTFGGFFVLTIIQIDMNLPSPIPIAVQTYYELSRIPTISMIRSITYFIIVPLWTILITLAYKEYIGEITPNGTG